MHVRWRCATGNERAGRTQGYRVQLRVAAAMYLIQILLPAYDNEGLQYANTLYLQTHDELVERFGGLTDY